MRSFARDFMMAIRTMLAAACVTASLALVVQVDQSAAGQGGGRAGVTAPGQASRAPIGGTLTPAKADARGWRWQVKASVNPATPRPFYHKARERMFQDEQITSYTISSSNPDLYGEGRPRPVHGTRGCDRARRDAGTHP